MAALRLALPLLLLSALVVCSPFTSAAREMPSPKSPRRELLLFGRFRCHKSTLSGYGYTSQKNLGQGLVLHWKATTGTTLQLALQATAGSSPSAGWFAVGWSPNGDMGGSNAVAMEAIGAPPGVYDLVGQVAANPATTWTVSDASIAQGPVQGVVMRFTRKVGDGSSVGIRMKGTSRIVFAYGSGTAVTLHTWAEHKRVDFSCGCGLFMRKC